MAKLPPGQSVPDPRRLVSRELHLAFLYAYHEQGHLLSEDDAFVLQHCIEAYHRQSRVKRNLYYKAKDILLHLHEIA